LRNGFKADFARKKRVTAVKQSPLIIMGLKVLYSIEIASTGHSSTQAPQSTQAPSSTTATLSCIEMASTGQESTHAPQPVQVSLLTTAGIIVPFN
jgi:hypothetical protein